MRRNARPDLPKMTMPEALLFDLDGVIIDSERYSDKINIEVISSFGHVYDREKIKPHIAGKPYIDGAKFLVQYYNLPISPEEFNAIRIEKRNYFYASEITFVSGFQDFYKELKKKFSLQTAVVTGCDKSNFESVDKRLGISNLFNGNIFMCEMVKNPKPARDIYLYAAKSLGVDITKCVTFEDSPTGITAGLRAKAKVIAVETSFSKKILEQKLNEIMTEGYNKENILFFPDYNLKLINKIYNI